MAFTLAMLDTIETAIASGTLSCSYEGKSVTYRSLDEMLRVRSIMRTSLGLSKKGATVLAAHDRGYGGSRPRDTTTYGGV
jgi:hypothetical protein